MASTCDSPDDDTVAFGLAAAARQQLSRADIDDVYVAIGVGDTFEAIEALLTAMARERIAISSDLEATTSRWLTFYRAHEAQPRLQQLLAEINTLAAQQDSS